MFKQAATHNDSTDLQEYSEIVSAYITECIEELKTITVRTNQKPWLTGEAPEQNAAFTTVLQENYHDSFSATS